MRSARDEVAVVGDGEDRATVRIERGLQGLTCEDVEVAGGLVEDEQALPASTSFASERRRRSPYFRSCNGVRTASPSNKNRWRKRRASVSESSVVERTGHEG